MANIEVIKTDGTAITKPARLFDPTETLVDYGGDWAAYRAAMEAAGKDFWLPVIRNPKPTTPVDHHDAQPLPPAIQATQVVYDWAAPIAKTPAELDAELEAIVAQMDQNRSFAKGLARIVFKIARGDWSIPQPTLTVQQFKDQIKLASEE